jgi:hypothetical protein
MTLPTAIIQGQYEKFNRIFAFLLRTGLEASAFSKQETLKIMQKNAKLPKERRLIAPPWAV